MPSVHSSTGTGPGPITPDGCAVEFYALYPDEGESQIVHDAAGPGASILELGCGAGRVTRPLTALGHAVVAVDESADMLARVTGAETVCSSIEDLSLGRRFDAVLLSSNLINTPDDDVRAALLATCRAHVSEGGCVIVQQHPPEWFEIADDRERAAHGMILRLRDIARPAPGLLSGTAEYVSGDRRWTQTFTARQLTEPMLTAALAAAGLRLDRYLTPNQGWFRAVPVPP
jgi:SAM-dependent methyltransferase